MAQREGDRLLQAACEFQGKSLEARLACRERYRREERNEENILRILIDGQFGLLAEKLARKVEPTNPSISYQIGVCVSFIRTHFVVSDLILNGDLVEALVLSRKQLESLARLHELDSKPLQKLVGKVPNIQNILSGPAGRMYGDLSEVAHFSAPRVAELLHVFEQGELIGPSMPPVYSERSGACFDVNCFVAVYFIAWLVEKLTSWYPGYDNSEENRLLGQTVLLAYQSGVLRKPEGTA